MPSVQPVLDLRKVGSQIREEIQLTKVKKKVLDVIETSKKNEEMFESTQPKSSKVEPILVPTTGKAKKKLAQRNSLNDSVEHEIFEEDVIVSEKNCRARKKDILFETHRLKSRERKSEKEQKLLEERGRKDKHLHQKDLVVEPKRVKKPSRKLTKQNIQEEESSSTTTESSNEQIYEDLEKESQKPRSNQKVTILTPTKVVKPLKRQTSITNSSENVSSKQTSFLRSKSKPNIKEKSVLTEKAASNRNGNKKFDIFDTMDSDKSYMSTQSRSQGYKESKKRDKKERRDKNIFRNKNHSERSPKISESDLNAKEQSKSPSFFIPLPTVITAASVWGESRAKFSDVVARSEPQICSISPSDNIVKPLSSTSLSQGKTTSGKPTMYVEPFKPVELGPIGSKRQDVPEERSSNFFQNDGLLDNLETDHLRNLESEAFAASRNTAQLNDRSIIAAIAGNAALLSDNNLSLLATHQMSNSLLSQWGSLNQNLNQISSFPNSQVSTAQQLSNQLLASQLLTNLNNSGHTMDADMWNRQQLLKSLLDTQTHELQQLQERTLTSSSTNTRMEDPWNEDLLNSSSYWNNSFPESATSSEDASNPTSSYLWGSNPVWKPWSPSERNSAPGTPRGTPPGLPPPTQQSQQKIEDQQEKRDSYSPFQAGGIFPQTEKSPWTYDGPHK